MKNITQLILIIGLIFNSNYGFSSKKPKLNDSKEVKSFLNDVELFNKEFSSHQTIHQIWTRNINGPKLVNLQNNLTKNEFIYKKLDKNNFLSISLVEGEDLVVIINDTIYRVNLSQRTVYEPREIKKLSTIDKFIYINSCSFLNHWNLNSNVMQNLKYSKARILNSSENGNSKIIAIKTYDMYYIKDSSIYIYTYPKEALKLNQRFDFIEEHSKQYSNNEFSKFTYQLTTYSEIFPESRANELVNEMRKCYVQYPIQKNEKITLAFQKPNHLTTFPMLNGTEILGTNFKPSKNPKLKIVYTFSNSPQFWNFNKNYLSKLDSMFSSKGVEITMAVENGNVKSIYEFMETNKFSFKGLSFTNPDEKLFYMFPSIFLVDNNNQILSFLNTGQPEQKKEMEKFIEEYLKR